MSEEHIRASETADWVQVVMNGGPPCFHLEEGAFCLRAKHWAGHENGRSHPYISLADLLKRIPRLEEHVRMFHAGCGGMIVGTLDDLVCAECHAQMSAFVSPEEATLLDLAGEIAEASKKAGGSGT